MGSRSDFLLYVQAAAAFGLVLTLWWLGLLVWARKRQGEKQTIAQRLGTATEETQGEGRALRLWHEGKEAVTYVAGARSRASMKVRFERLCRDAGFHATPRVIATSVIVTALIMGLVLGLVSGRVFPAFVGAMAVFLGFWTWIHKRAAKRARIFERQLVEALELSARALRAGHPLMASFQLISVEVPPPVGHLFAGIVQQQAMGMRLDEALRRAAADGASPDLDLFAAAMTIHTRTGGNLADVMGSIALVIRERLRLQRRFRTLVAQTQVSKRILVAMPIIMFGVLHLISPEYTEQLYATSTGSLLLGTAAGCLACGWAVMNKMAELKP
jgi:tight adherence protein B